MTTAKASETTQLLLSAGAGDEAAAPKLMAMVYDELRALAASYLVRERPDHTLEATALVHEAYMRLVDQSRVQWKDQGHFFAVAAIAMRRVLVNHARSRGRLKRGGDRSKLSFDEALSIGAELDADLVALDDALKELGELDARKAQVVELRFFAGQTIEDSARILSVSDATVRRDWDFAKAWLLDRLTCDDD